MKIMFNSPNENPQNGFIASLQRWSRWGFWAGAILVVFAVYDLGGVAFKDPYGMHQWRQCDAYSMALNFALEERDLFHPSMHFLHGTGTGEAAGEFPLTYFLNGRLWRGTGIWPWTLRWMHLAMLLAGIGALFSLCRRFISLQSSLLVAWMTMMSGLMAFYGPNYLVNAAALGWVFIGWWSAERWHRNGMVRDRWLALMLGALTLAALFRPTMVLGWVPLLVATAHVRKRRIWLLACFLPICVGIGWILWAKMLNAANGSVYFLTTIRPVWEALDPWTVWHSFREDVLPQWHHPFVLLATLLIMVVTLLKTGRSDNPAERSVGFSWLGMLVGLMAYFVLWFENLDVHDYYLIEFQLIIPITFGWIMLRWEGLPPGLWRRIVFGIAWTALVFQGLESAIRTRMKHQPVGGWLAETFIPQRERDIWSWHHWDQERRFSNISEWEAVLRSLGIDRLDGVISIPDPSPNITLSLIDQRGFTNLYDDAFQGEDRIAFYVSKGAKYLICNDPDAHAALQESPWLSRELTNSGNFRVFDLLNSDATLHSRERNQHPEE